MPDLKKALGEKVSFGATYMLEMYNVTKSGGT